MHIPYVQYMRGVTYSVLLNVAIYPRYKYQVYQSRKQFNRYFVLFLKCWKQLIFSDKVSSFSVHKWRLIITDDLLLWLISLEMCVAS